MGQSEKGLDNVVCIFRVTGKLHIHNGLLSGDHFSARSWVRSNFKTHESSCCDCQLYHEQLRYNVNMFLLCFEQFGDCVNMPVQPASLPPPR